MSFSTWLSMIVVIPPSSGHPKVMFPYRLLQPLYPVRKWPILYARRSHKYQLLGLARSLVLRFAGLMLMVGVEQLYLSVLKAVSVTWERFRAAILMMIIMAPRGLVYLWPCVPQVDPQVHRQIIQAPVVNLAKS